MFLFYLLWTRAKTVCCELVWEMEPTEIHLPCSFFFFSQCEAPGWIYSVIFLIHAM